MLPKPFGTGPAHFVAFRPAKDFFTHRPSSPPYVTVIYINEDFTCVEEEWLKDIIVKFEKLDDIELTPRSYKLLQSLCTRWMEVADTANPVSSPPPGVYYVIDKQLHDIWKLYEDSHGAFLTALVPGVDGRLSQFQIGAVPSRFQITATPSHPLGGWRVTTSVCNRAFYELYPSPFQTTACIRLLQEKGAPPWNYRADGHQSPAGSSSGSGVAFASYQWVDIAVGSDTSGSGRRPGHWNGCFAYRPSHGVLLVEATTVPPEIIYPTEYMSFITNKDQLKIIDNFVADLEKSLGVKQKRVSFNEVWDSDRPEEAKGETRNSFFHDDYHNFDEFREDYQKAFKKTPYVSPPVRWQWNLSAGITKEERDIAVYRLSVYEKWCLEKILQIGTHNTIILIPIENTTPRYRNESLGRYFNPVGVPMLFVAPILKAPKFTVPIGEVPFLSKVTGNVEQLLVAISLLGVPCRHLELTDIASDCRVILFGRQKPEASTSLPKILRHSTKPTFRRF
ncbi:amidase signature enzyme [Hyaloscypha hepaticicola]|uniref:Amidase signature enzyme n=1 Tax=Hyaloscypha hepaticicola TaxID=2082293 RepID=A0A2J6PRW3_9HELO|nr:amidase signature enzyme [Hyaloscypha hepaticicola]